MKVVLLALALIAEVPQLIHTPAPRPVASRAATAILGITSNGDHMRPGSSLAIDVVTTGDVDAVVMHVGSWNSPFVRTAPGKFHFEHGIPLLPPFAIGNWSVDIVARAANGTQVQRTLKISYGYF
jgi:hypothetical protein